MNKLDEIYTKDVEQFSKLYFDYLKDILDKIDLTEVRLFVDALLSARERSAFIFFIGNGGSAATASHFANDLAFGTNDYKKSFKALSIADNISSLTALANDFGYEDVFVRQLKVYASTGDILVGISASGNSPNIIRAFEYASSIGVQTVALTAFDGGRMKEIADQGVHIPTGNKEYGPAEDLHMILDHLIGSYLMRLIKK